jgi:hypothetical protein
MRTLVLAACMVVGLASNVARADALAGPPTCEPGFQGLPPTDHHGGRCEPWRCHHDSDCSPRPGVAYEASCQAAGLCMVSGVATATCAHAGEACGDPSGGGRCVAARLCLPLTPALPPGGPRSEAPRSRTSGALAFTIPVLCAGFVFWDLRRKRRPTK